MSALADRIDALAVALASDAAIKAWCNANYGRDHKVFSYFIDLLNPPKAAATPCIQIGPANAAAGNAAGSRARQLWVVFWIYDSASRTVSPTNILEFQGGKNLVDLVQLTITAIGAVSIGNELLDRVEATFADLEHFPWFMAGMSFGHAEDYCLGMNRLTL